MRLLFSVFVFTITTLISVNIASTALAQSEDTCPAYVEESLTLVDEFCSGIGRNEACYGNIEIDSILRTPVEFTTPGDIIGVETVQSLDLTPFDPAENIWGIALLRLQAGFSEMLPGQNATMLLFGDVEIENVGGEISAEPIALTAQGGVNIRNAPSTTATIAGALADGDVVDALARTPDAQWVQITLENETLAWVFARLFSAGDADLTTLPIAEAGFDPSAYTPMQAFYFRSGVGDASCATIPESGILLQTPRGLQRVDFRVNGVDISVGSTVFLQAEAGDGLYIRTLDGTALVQTDFDRTIVTTGEEIRVPLDSNLQPNGNAQAVSDAPFEGESIVELLPDEISANLPEDAVRVTVPADQAWTRTGIMLENEQLFQISAGGMIKLCEADACGDPFWDHWVTPNGEPGYSAPAPGQLIARIDDGRLIPLNSSGVFSATAAGELQLGLIDSIHDDNVGEFGVIVTPLSND